MSKIQFPIDNLQNFLEIKNQTENSADLYFYGDIVSSWWGAWDDTDQYPEAVKNFLDGVKGKDLNIHINSGGGSVFAGITIYNMLKNHSGFKTVYIDGLAASIASVIALAGDKVVMRTGSSLMIHKPMFGIWGMYNSDEFRKMATDLDSIQECIMQVYKENIKDNVDIKTIEEMVNNETWMSSDEAEKYFKIEVETSLQAVACSSEYLEKFCNIPKDVMRNRNELELFNFDTELLILEEN
ncbi:MAG: Clp protease ClpP [Clostridium celatum]|nr:Clp protease ClpP [Clostridium celatum]